jgi:hypothetical protein
MYSSDSDSEGEYMQKAFYVDGELSPDSGPPTDGLSYLKHVR